jgi:hypothetical protein
MPEIVENYRGYAAPTWVRATVTRLLSTIEPHHLNGLGTIVLTDAASIGRGKTHRVTGRKYSRRECRGFYHPSWHGQKAWIELVIDNMLADFPKSLLMIPFVQDLIVSRTLFHEIGHHIHGTVASAARSSEAAANDWSDRLARPYFLRRYWYLACLFRMVRAVVVVPLRRLTARLSGRATRAAHRERSANRPRNSSTGFRADR